MSRITSAKAGDVRLNNLMRRRDASTAAARERLSSGAKINRAGDDAAGLAMSVTLNHRNQAYASARVNAHEALSYLQTKEAFMAPLVGMYDRRRELAVRSSSESISDSERSVMSVELEQIKASFDETLEQTFNTHRLFAEVTGTNGILGSGDMSFQVGIDADRFARVNTVTLKADTLKRSWNINKHRFQVGSKQDAQDSLTLISKGLARVNVERSLVGATHNRMNVALNNIDTTIENGVASESLIRDADFAEETSRLTRLDIMSQATVALVSQVNDVRKMALQLLK
ncbi:MAG: flagellin [Myxococcota bacterium]|nr:flagellin [Myxococcota bacterium]